MSATHVAPASAGGPREVRLHPFWSLSRRNGLPLHAAARPELEHGWAVAGIFLLHPERHYLSSTLLGWLSGLIKSSLFSIEGEMITAWSFCFVTVKIAQASQGPRVQVICKLCWMPQAGWFHSLFFTPWLILTIKINSEVLVLLWILPNLCSLGLFWYVRVNVYGLLQAWQCSLLNIGLFAETKAQPPLSLKNLSWSCRTSHLIRITTLIGASASACQERLTNINSLSSSENQKHRSKACFPAWSILVFSVHGELSL